VDQVFFCDAHDEPGWKLVLCKEVRGKQIFQSVGATQEEGMFQTDEDDDHESLHYKNAAFYITHFHVLGVRPEHDFHLSLGNTKESRSLCYGRTC
jgi:hypothetical protein